MLIVHSSAMHDRMYHERNSVDTRDPWKYLDERVKFDDSPACFSKGGPRGSRSPVYCLFKLDIDEWLESRGMKYCIFAPKCDKQLRLRFTNHVQ